METEQTVLGIFDSSKNYHAMTTRYQTPKEIADERVKELAKKGTYANKFTEFEHCKNLFEGMNIQKTIRESNISNFYGQYGKQLLKNLETAHAPDYFPAPIKSLVRPICTNFIPMLYLPHKMDGQKFVKVEERLNEFHGLHKEVLDLKIGRNQLKLQYKRLSSVILLNKCKSSIETYKNQLTAFDSGRIVAETFKRNAEKQDLIQQYAGFTQTVIESLESQLPALQKKVDTDPIAQELLMLLRDREEIITKFRTLKNNKKRYLKQFVNVGKDGILGFNDQKNRHVNSRIITESMGK